MGHHTLLAVGIVGAGFGGLGGAEESQHSALVEPAVVVEAAVHPEHVRPGLLNRKRKS